MSWTNKLSKFPSPFPLCLYITSSRWPPSCSLLRNMFCFEFNLHVTPEPLYGICVCPIWRHKLFVCVIHSSVDISGIWKIIINSILISVNYRIWKNMISDQGGNRVSSTVFNSKQKTFWLTLLIAPKIQGPPSFQTAPHPYFRLHPNFDSSISMMTPCPPECIRWAWRYAEQTSLQKLYQSMRLFSVILSASR